MCNLGVSRFLGVLFEDKRATIGLVASWGLITVIGFWCFGAFHIQFMTFGPSNDTKFMGMVIDTWGKWFALALFSFVNTAINEFLGNALVPWFTNTIQDHKTKFIPYSKMTCLVISQIHTVYCHVMGSLALLMFFCQVDFLLVRLVADLIVNHYSILVFMNNKVHDLARYSDEKNCHPLLPAKNGDPVSFVDIAMEAELDEMDPAGLR